MFQLQQRRVLVVGSPALAHVLQQAMEGLLPQPYNLCSCRTVEELTRLMESKTEYPPDVVVIHAQSAAERRKVVKALKSSSYRYLPVLVVLPSGETFWERLHLWLTGTSKVVRGPCALEQLCRAILKLARWRMQADPVVKENDNASARALPQLPLSA